MADEFLGEIGKTIEKAGQFAAEKTSSLIEAAKVTAQLSSEQKEIDKLLREIGASVLKRARLDEAVLSEDEKATAEEIASHKEIVLKLKQELAGAKNQKVCGNCEELIPADADFCPRCGASVKHTETAAEPEQSEIEQDQMISSEEESDS